MFFGRYSKQAAFALATLLALALCLPVRSGEAEHENILRLHVIANSDSAADQRVKLRVRDAVLACVEASESAEQTRRYILSHGAELLEAAENTLREHGFDYGAQLMLGSYEFPDRSYDGKLYPAGSYSALRVVLGSGAGRNWWCVLFPPLCIVTAEQEPLPEMEDIEFESTILRWLRSMGVIA